jgi:hypothetical protein
MIGFAKFQDDLAVIRVGLESAPLTSTNAAACAALIRVCEFANTLENLDLHELPEVPQSAAACCQANRDGLPCDCASEDWSSVESGPFNAPEYSLAKSAPPERSRS